MIRYNTRNRSGLSPAPTQQRKGLYMAATLAGLRQFNLLSVTLRLLLALGAGGVVGYGRAKKQRNAGLRTYMLISLGAALTILISLYEYELLQGRWAYMKEIESLKFDASRFAAQVINGIGFLATGTIIATGHQQVSGLTSAIGLFACVTMGIAAGAGFYECVLIAMVLIILSLEVMQPLELAYKRRLRNITLLVEFERIESVALITEFLRSRDVTIYDIDVERTRKKNGKRPCAVMILKLSRENSSHSAMLSSLAEMECVYSVQELIS